MKIDLYRIKSGENDTIGLFFIDGLFECFTLEDEYRTIKIKGETRILAGHYWVDFRKVDSPSTQKYRERYLNIGFDYHLMLLDVPEFEYIYIHPGVDESHTDGCILVGDSINSNITTNATLGKSREAFERIYQKISKVLKGGNKVQIEVHDSIC